MKKRPLEERFWEKVNKTETCWLWTGGCSKKGYGSIWNSEGEKQTHRLSWVIHYGAIPDDMKVLHKCDNPPCVNPDHLFLGSYADNNRDRDEKGRQWNAAKIECKYGHNNWRERPNGHRTCNTCERNYYENNKDKWQMNEDQKQSRNDRRRENYKKFIEGGGNRSDWAG